MVRWFFLSVFRELHSWNVQMNEMPICALRVERECAWQAFAHRRGDPGPCQRRMCVGLTNWSLFGSESPYLPCQQNLLSLVLALNGECSVDKGRWSGRGCLAAAWELVF